MRHMFYNICVSRLVLCTFLLCTQLFVVSTSRANPLTSAQEAFPPANCDSGGVIKWEGLGAAKCHEFDLDCFGGFYLQGSNQDYGNPLLMSNNSRPQSEDRDSNYVNNPPRCPTGYTPFMVGDAACGDTGFPNENEFASATCSVMMCIGSCTQRPGVELRPNAYAWFIETVWGQYSSVPGVGYDAGTDQRCMGKYVENASACDPITCTRVRQYLCDADYKEYRTVNCRTTTDGKGLVVSDQNCINSITARDDYGAEGFRRRTCVLPIPGGQAGGSTCRCEHGINYSNEGWSGACPPHAPVTEACTDSPFCQACPSQRITWGNGNPNGNTCSAMSGDITANTTTTVTNTEPGYTGQVQARCFGGTVTPMLPASCSPTAPVGCVSTTLQWSNGSTTGSDCQAPTGNLPHDPSNTVQIFDNETSATPDTGSIYVRCDNGVLTKTLPASCSAPSRGCLSTTVSWRDGSTAGNDCSASTGTLNEGERKQVNNTRSGYTGDIYVACNSGVITESLPSTCSTVQAGGCPASNVSWRDGSTTGSDCSAPTPAMADGRMWTITNTRPGYDGNIIVECNSGILTEKLPANCSVQQAAGCQPKSILWSDGTTGGRDCEATTPRMNDGDRVQVTNTSAGASGDIFVECNDGTVTESLPATCGVRECSVSWSGEWDENGQNPAGPCRGGVNQTVREGDYLSLVNSASGYSGLININCIDGTSNHWEVDDASATCSGAGSTSCLVNVSRKHWAEKDLRASGPCNGGKYVEVDEGDFTWLKNDLRQAPDYDGQVKIVCNDASTNDWEYIENSATCSLRGATTCTPPPDISWSQGAVPGSRDCYADSFSPNSNPQFDGGIITATNKNPGFTGSIKLTCDVANNRFNASNINCTSTAPLVDGKCGTANGGSYSSYPSSGHCAEGTEFVVDSSGGDGTYNWRCEGSGGGSNETCSATKASSVCQANSSFSFKYIRNFYESDGNLTGSDADNFFSASVPQGSAGQNHAPSNQSSLVQCPSGYDVDGVLVNAQAHCDEERGHQWTQYIQGQSYTKGGLIGSIRCKKPDSGNGAPCLLYTSSMNTTDSCRNDRITGGFLATAAAAGVGSAGDIVSCNRVECDWPEPDDYNMCKNMTSGSVRQWSSRWPIKKNSGNSGIYPLPPYPSGWQIDDGATTNQRVIKSTDVGGRCFKVRHQDMRLKCNNGQLTIDQTLGPEEEWLSCAQ